MTRRQKKEFQERVALRDRALVLAIEHRKSDTSYAKHVVETAQRYERYLLTGRNEEQGAMSG